MLWTLSVHNNSMGSVPIRSPNTIPFSGHRCRSTSYHFSLPGDVRGGELRELRDPYAGLEEEWLLPVGRPLAYIPVPLLLRPLISARPASRKERQAYHERIR